MGGWASILFFCSGRAGGRRDFVVEIRVGVGGRPGTPGPVGGPVCSLIACWVVYYETTHEHHEAPERTFKHVSFYVSFQNIYIHTFDFSWCMSTLSMADSLSKAYIFLQIRNKPFPWEASDCTLFDLQCHKDYYAAKAKTKADTYS